MRIVEPKDFIINFGSLILSLNWNRIQCQCLGYYIGGWGIEHWHCSFIYYSSAFTMTTEHGWMMISSWEKTMIPDPCHSEAGTFWLRKYLLCSVWPELKIAVSYAVGSCPVCSGQKGSMLRSHGDPFHKEKEGRVHSTPAFQLHRKLKGRGWILKQSVVSALWKESGQQAFCS